MCLPIDNNEANVSFGYSRLVTTPFIWEVTWTFNVGDISQHHQHSETSWSSVWNTLVNFSQKSSRSAKPFLSTLLYRTSIVLNVKNQFKL